jgi:hypothetical protein
LDAEGNPFTRPKTSTPIAMKPSKKNPENSDIKKDKEKKYDGTLLPDVIPIEKGSEEYRYYLNIDKTLKDDTFKYRYLIRFLDFIYRDTDCNQVAQFCDEPKMLDVYQNDRSKCKTGSYVIEGNNLVKTFRNWTLKHFDAELNDSKLDLLACIKPFFTSTSIKSVPHYIIYTYILDKNQ